MKFTILFMENIKEHVVYYFERSPHHATAAIEPAQ